MSTNLTFLLTLGGHFGAEYDGQFAPELGGQFAAEFGDHFERILHIIAVTTIRLSRFKLIQGRWFKIKIELPFQIGGGSEMSGYASPVSTMSISIKGDSFNEVFINNFYEEYFYMYPVSSRIGEIPDRQFAYIEKKLFLKNDESFYLAKLFSDETKQSFKYRLLKPKTREKTMMYEKYPIVAIMIFDSEEQLSDESLSAKDFDFQEWAYIKSVEQVKQADAKRDQVKE